MKPIQNPFSLYDFLGYLIPGLLLILGVLFLSDVGSVVVDPIGTINTALSSISIELSLVALVVCYFLGQIISYISSMTVEKYSNWTIGYPSKYLLRIETSSFWELQTKGWTRVVDILIRLILCGLMLPMVLLDLLVGNVFKFRRTLAKPLDKQLVTVIVEKAFALVKACFTSTYEHNKDDDFFRIYYHYALEKCPNHYAKFQNYVALYGFTRTMTIVTVILFWFNLFQAVSCRVDPSICMWTLAILAGLSYLMYASFNKFYRKFSLEVLMAISANYEVK
jgi:hypothetical protein